MKIEKIMTKKVYSLKGKHRLIDACNLMKNKNIGCVTIIDEENHLEGIVTDRDIVIALAKGSTLDTLIENVMTKNIHTLLETDTIVDLTEVLGYNQIRRVPIVNDEQKLIGIVTLGDLSLATFTESIASEALAEISYNPTRTDIINYLYE